MQIINSFNWLRYALYRIGLRPPAVGRPDIAVAELPPPRKAGWAGKGVR